ncbi:5-formyltetrahydrofolate cyclo-ligase [Gammaproteobacteria bacterium]
MTRAQLRCVIRCLRRDISSAERARRALRLTRRIQGLPFFRNSQRVALYLSNDGEIDPSYLIRRADRAGKKCYLPVLCPLGSRHLWFALYHPGDPLRPNRFRILEPIHPYSHWVRARALDLIFVPLVAFDAAGNRLGMGGGYYDQTLSYLAYRRYWRKPRVVGIAYDFQRVATLKPQPWDVPLSTVVTEVRIYHSPRTA